MNDITPEQIAAWFQAQAEELSKRTGYAAIYLSAHQLDDYKPAPKWRIYIDDDNHTEDCATFAECLEKINEPK